MRIFVAGAGGAIGRQLLPQLIADGHQVTASTRNPGKAGQLQSQGAKAVVLNGLDGPAVAAAVADARPDIVIHQMTSLASGFDLRRFEATFAVTNRLRTEGTDNLLAAAAAAGAGRFIAQSFTGWSTVRTGPRIKTEDDPLDPHPPAAQRGTLAAIRHLEEAVLGSASIDGMVLRYGLLYGPGASDLMVEQVRRRRVPLIGNGEGIWSWLHVHDAAAATVAAVDRGPSGVYNVVDDDPAPVSAWLPVLADAIGAKPPRHLPAWLGRLAAGELAVIVMTEVRGSSNEKAKRELGWAPAWPSWRQGFRAGMDAARPAS